MKTFDLTVDNLGPIKHATFTSSHMNVLCGKNNSGKSFLIHAVYCIFQYLQYFVSPEPKEEHFSHLIETGICEFSVGEYLSNLNSHIEKMLPEIVRRLPSLMNKSHEAFNDCSMSLRINPDYLESFIYETPINIPFMVSKNLRIVISKPNKSKQCRIVIENAGEKFPPREMLRSVMSFALRQLVGTVLPAPVLITAERAGVASFASDVMAYAISKQSDKNAINANPFAEAMLSEHYPMAIVDELSLYNDIRQIPEGKEYRMAGVTEADFFYDWFKNNVMDGDVVSREGKLFYLQKSTNVNMPMTDASTSARALIELNHFVHYIMRPGSLLLIDEPELNLHPDRQRQLMRALCMMANQIGVGVVVSTHSDYMLRELNMLMRIGKLPQEAKDRILGDYSIPNASIIDKDDVAVYVVGSGSAKSMQLDTMYGFAVSSFDDTIESFNALYSEISDAMES